jgi:hypothetical protein
MMRLVNVLKLGKSFLSKVCIEAELAPNASRDC